MIATHQRITRRAGREGGKCNYVLSHQLIEQLALKEPGLAVAVDY